MWTGNRCAATSRHARLEKNSLRYLTPHAHPIIPIASHSDAGWTNTTAYDRLTSRSFARDTVSHIIWFWSLEMKDPWACRLTTVALQHIKSWDLAVVLSNSLRTTATTHTAVVYKRWRGGMIRHSEIYKEFDDLECMELNIGQTKDRRIPYHNRGTIITFRFLARQANSQRWENIRKLLSAATRTTMKALARLQQAVLSYDSRRITLKSSDLSSSQLK